MNSIFTSDLIFFVPFAYLVSFVLVGLAVFVTYSGSYVSAGHLPQQFSRFLVVGTLLSTALLNIAGADFKNHALNMVFSSPFLTLYSNIVLLGFVISLLLYSAYSQFSRTSAFEVPFFFAIVTLSTLVIILSQNFLLIYLSLELQALSLYVLAASRMNSTYSVEAGLKYFVLGSFASCLLLLGFSFLYGLSGTFSFFDLYCFSSTADLNYQYNLVFAFLVVVCGFLFKVGAAPFHFWVPDIYAGSSLVVTSFFALVPKVASWVVLAKLSYCSMVFFQFYFGNVFVLVGLLSVIIGAYGALSQLSIKRLLAYSAVAQAGYLLLALSSGANEGLEANIIFLIVYVLTLCPIFVALSTLRLAYSNGEPLDSVENLAFLYKHSSLLGVLFIFSFLSLAGFPPFAGFFSKLFVFYSLINTRMLLLAFFTLVVSVVSAVYYLRVVRFSFIFKDEKTYLLFYETTRPLLYFYVFSVLLLSTPFLWVEDLYVMVKSLIIFRLI